VHKNWIPWAASAFALLLISLPVGAQQAHHYQLIVVGTFGGPNSSLVDTGVPGGVFLNGKGVLTGYADLQAGDPYPAYCFIDCYVDHAFVRHDGFVHELGVLPGGWSSAATAISANGLIAGFAVNGEIDPLIPGFPEQRGVLWHDGYPIDLGTLPEGGYEAEAYSVNTRGQVVGTAFNTLPDPDTLGLLIFNQIFSPTEARAFLWRYGAMQDLGTLGGNDAAAFVINEREEVMGWSYTSTTQDGSDCSLPLALGSFLWDEAHGMRNLGGFGGNCTQAWDLNNHGQVVGWAFTPEGISRAFLWQADALVDLGGDLGGGYTGAFALNDRGQAAGFGYLAGEVYFHATFWPRVGQIIDLKTIGDDSCSSAKAINSKGQVVGDSISLSNCVSTDDSSRAFLWQDGAIFDLNALIPSGSPLYLVHPQNINDRGEIAGVGDDAGGNQHVFLLIPCDENHPGIGSCDYTPVDAEVAAQLSRALAAQRAMLLPASQHALKRLQIPRPHPTPGPLGSGAGEDSP
jgi:probable HAF family extracellular repeat protein